MSHIRLAVPMLLVGVTIILAAVTLTWLRRADAEPPATPPPLRERLVVLPFADLTERDGMVVPTPHWLRDGLTEALITQLGRLEPGRLGIIARHSAMQFQGSKVPLDEIARRLDVDWAIEGAFATVGGRHQVSVRLVRPDDATVVWADRFEADRGAADSLVRGVASGVATALVDRLLAGDRVARLRGGTMSSQAYEAFLIGRSAWHRFETEGYLEARAAFERALAADPDFAAAHAALADAYNLLAFTDAMNAREALARAEASAREALARDPVSAMAHNALAFARLYGRVDVSGSLSHFARAIELDTNYAMAHHWRAGALAAAGRVDEAVASAERAVELDPLSLSVISDLGWYLIYADRYEEAADLCRETLDAQPGYGWAESCLYEASRNLGDFETARTLVANYRQPTDAERATHPAIDAADPESALEALDRLGIERQLAREAPNALTIAELEARLGNTAGALEWLERAADEGDPWWVFVPVQPFFDSLHGEPKLRELARRVGLPSAVIDALSSASAFASE